MNTFHYASIDGHMIFYREAGASNLPKVLQFKRPMAPTGPEVTGIRKLPMASV